MRKKLLDIFLISQEKRSDFLNLIFIIFMLCHQNSLTITDLIVNFADEISERSNRKKYFNSIYSLMVYSPNNIFSGQLFLYIE